ncbi:MAG: ATP-grasp domain-containing protein [Candidatus Dormibacteria bacterium]
MLLVMPTSTYRAPAFLRASERLGLDVTLATDDPAGPPVGTPAIPWETLVEGRGPIPAALRDVAAVVGVDETSVLPAARVAARLGLPGNPIDAAMATRDKSLLRRALQGTGLPQPRWTDWPPDCPAPELGYPCVVKPTSGAASFGVIRADDREELILAGARVRRLLGDRATLLVESYLPGPEIAVEALMRDGELLPLAIFDKPDPLDGPYFAESIYLLPSELPPADQGAVAEVLAAAASAVNLRQGPVHAEFRLGSGSPTLIDLASRSIGGRCSQVLRFRSGASLEELILRQAMGMPLPDLQLEPDPAGVLMLSPERAGRLVSIEGREAVLRIPGVEAVDLTAPPGSIVAPAPEGDRYLGFVFARAGSSAEVRAALGAARERLVVTMEDWPPAS